MFNGTGVVCSVQKERHILEDEVLRPVQSLGALRVCGRRGVLGRQLSLVSKEAELTGSRSSKRADGSNASQPAESPTDRRQLRGRHVWRRWKRATGFRHVGDQQRFWRTLDPRIIGFVVSLFASLFALPLELTWWDVEWDLLRVLPLVENTGPLLAVALAGSWLASGVGLSRLLQRRLPRTDHRRWSHRLRGCLLVGFPLVGFHFLTLAHRRLADRTGNENPRETAKLDPLSWRAGVAPTRLRFWWESLRIAGSWFLPWYLASVGVFAWAVLWLAAQRGPGVGMALLVAAGSLHVVAFAVRWSTGPEAAPFSAREPWEAGFHRAATWLLLLPHPVPLLWLMVSLSEPRVEKHRSQTVVRAAFRPGTEVNRLPHWRSLSRALHGQWERLSWTRRWFQTAGDPRLQQTTLSVRNLGTLYRLKIGLTYFDGLLLGWLLYVLAERRLVSPGVLQGALDAILWGGLGMVLLGSATFLGCLLAVLLRLPVGFRASGLPLLSKFLALSCGALVLGLSTGVHLGRGDLQSAGVWLALPVALLLSFIAFGVILRPVSQSLPGVDRCLDPTARPVWILAPMTLGVAGVVLAVEGAMARVVADLLVVCAGLSPLAHAALAFTLGGWLLRPFTVRDLTIRSLPSRRRWTLRLLAVTVVLPLGGLAVPWWIFLRSRWKAVD